jgi:serine/threonine-protein kinase
MGVVWKAVDTKLQREVAIKVLPDYLAEDPEHLSRFEREAKLLASLNHRNIAAIYGLDQAEGSRFLVMELVEGEDLGKRLERGPLPVDEAIDVCHQLARALEAAHDKGVLHRDLKPANVQVTEEGRVKVLDFGLAKALEVESTSDDAAHSPTLTSLGTRAGVILGTAAYMSPEQARGKTLDKRSDIWAFGCVLYECLTGRAVFRGETISDTLASILKSEPDWSALPERTPPRVRELLQRCLAKEIRNRLRDAGDARLELQRSIAGRESLMDASAISLTDAPVARSPRKFSMATLGVAIILGLVVGAGLWSLLSGTGLAGRSGPTGALRFSVDYPKELFFDGTLLSPEGDAILFAGSPRKYATPEENVSKLYLRPFDSYTAEPLDGSDGVSHYSFSPDGRWIAMLTPVAPKSSKLRLSKLPVDGSAPPLVLLEWPQGWEGPLLWLPDGDLLARVPEPYAFVRIPSGGGSPKPPVEFKPQGFEGPFWFGAANAAVLPGGAHVLGSVNTYGERGFDTSVAILDLDTGETRILIENGNAPRWSPTGHLLFSRGATLLAVPFDLETLTPSGEQVAITDGLRADAIWADAGFQLSPDGTLMHWPGGLVGGNRQLVILDERVNIVGPWSEERRPFESSLKVSQDGRRLAVTMVNAEGLYDIWVSDMDPPRLSQLVQEVGEDCIPHLWSPEGEHLIYTCAATDGSRLLRRRGDGSGKAELLIETDSLTEWYEGGTFLPDGERFVATHVVAGETELVLLPFAPAADGDVEPTVLVPRARNPQISPDGRWIVYQSDVSGSTEVYLRKIHEDGSLGSEIPVSRGGGANPFWARGWEPLTVIYGRDLEVLSVNVTTEPVVRISDPRGVANVSEVIRHHLASTPLPEGGWLMIHRGEDEVVATEVNIVLDWFSELETRLSAVR